MTFHLLLIILALVCFILATVKSPEPQHLHFFSLGAVLVTLALFFVR